MKIFAQTLHIPGATQPIKGEITWAAKISDILNKSMNYIFLFAGVGLFLMLLSGGFTYLTSMGEPKKMASASQKIVLALGGFILVFVAYWIVQGVQYVFGLDVVF